MNGIHCELKNWESNFFKKKIFQLNINKALYDKALKDVLEDLLQKQKFDLIEINLDVKYIKAAEILEEIGFKLIDSRITFLTKIDSKEPKYDFPLMKSNHILRFYEKNDLPFLLELTHKYLTNNDDFVSRYKNLNYFNSSDGYEYFSKWISFSVNNPKSHTAIVEDKGKVVGFFIFQRKENYNDIPLYKGILVAVDEAYRGYKLHLSLQSFLFKNLESQHFYIDNTTQISNYPVIKNHIRSNRKLDRMELTFMCSKQDFNIT